MMAQAHCGATPVLPETVLRLSERAGDLLTTGLDTENGISMLRGQVWIHKCHVDNVTPKEKRRGTAHIYRVTGKLVDEHNTKLKFTVNVYKHWATFHGEQWLIASLLGEFDSCLVYKDIFEDPLPLAGKFTNIKQFDNGTFAICKEMQDYRHKVYNGSDRFLALVGPFDPAFYATAVHPNGVLLFDPFPSQIRLLCLIFQELQWVPKGSRYWICSDGSLILDEKGRWRAASTKRWLQYNPQASAPDDVQEEIQKDQFSAASDAATPGWSGWQPQLHSQSQEYSTSSAMKKQWQ